jgi:RNA polymerase sigma-70 factor, ECF subfamily
MDETSPNAFAEALGYGQGPDDHGAATPAALFRLHAQAVFALCLANTQNYHDAEDATQAVFLKAVAQLASLREPERARAWLLQVARRECVDFHRRRKPMESLVDDPPAAAEGQPAGERLNRAIQKLPQNYREAIVLYYLDGRDSANVAASLGTTRQAIRQRLVRARAMLHDLLEEDRP